MLELLSLFSPRAFTTDFLIPDAQVDAFRTEISNARAIIVNESPLRGSGYTEFRVRDVPTEIFFNYRTLNFTLNYSDTIRIELQTPNEIIIGGGVRIKTDKDNWREYIRIHAREKVSLKGITHYAINWSAIGTVSTTDTREFAQALTLAAIVADELQNILEKK